MGCSPLDSGSTRRSRSNPGSCDQIDKSISSRKRQKIQWLWETPKRAAVRLASLPSPPWNKIVQMNEGKGTFAVMPCRIRAAGGARSKAREEEHGSRIAELLRP